MHILLELVVVLPLRIQEPAAQLILKGNLLELGYVRLAVHQFPLAVELKKALLVVEASEQILDETVCIGTELPLGE